MFLSVLTYFALSGNTYDFITSELPQMYSFACSDNVTFRYMPLEGYKLLIRSNILVSCTRNSLTDLEVLSIPLNLEEKTDYFESDLLDLEIEPANIICKCETKDGNGSISPVVVQSVTGNSGILAMGIFSIIMVLIDIAIISVQFCTFHHRKSD